MNLLQEFEGLSGEVLASAALRILMLESPTVREAIIDVLSFNSTRGPLVSGSHFACYRELGTLDEEGSPGRLDLVIECDNAVLGIEAKFSAAFQPQQPAKYVSTLTLRADLMSKLRGAESSVEPQLFIVAPESRRADALRVSPDTSFVAWEEIVRAVQGSVGFPRFCGH